MVSAPPAGPMLGLGPSYGGTVYDDGGAEVNAGNPKYGMVFDGGWCTDGVMNGVNNVLTSASNSLTGAGMKIGAVITVAGAGVAGAALKTTVLGITSAGSITLTANSATAVAGVETHWGTDNTTNHHKVFVAARLVGGHIVYPANKNFCADLETLTDANIKEIDFNKSRWLQINEGHNAIASTVNQSTCDIHGGYYRALPKNASAVNNSFAVLQGSTAGTGTETNADQSDIFVHDMTITDCQYNAITIATCVNAHVWECRMIRCTDGIQYNNCSDSFITKNTVDGTNYTTSFGVGIQCVTWAATVPAGAHNVNITIAHNNVKNSTRSESMLLHDLADSNVFGNIITNQGTGIVLTIVQDWGHQIHDVVVEGNKVTLAQANTSNANNFSCIEVSGKSAGAFPYTTNNVTVTGNQLRQPNYLGTDGSQGWFKCDGAVQDIAFIANDCRDATGNGIFIGTTNGTIDGLTIQGNHGRTVRNGGGAQNNMIAVGDNTNAITRLYVRNNTWESATRAWALPASRDLSAAGYQEGDTWSGITAAHNFGGGAVALPARGLVVGDMYTPAGTPVITAGTGLGTGGSVGASLVGGNDYAGKVRGVSGTAGTGTGVVVHIAFSHTLLQAPIDVVISDGSTGAAKCVVYTSSVSTTGFDIACRTAPDVGAFQYDFTYEVIGAT